MQDVLNAINTTARTRITIRHCLDVVGGFYGITREQMLSPRRWRKVARPRQVAMALAREFCTSPDGRSYCGNTAVSLPAIGKHFGDRDHTTVLHAIRRVADLESFLPEFAAEVNGLRDRLRSYQQFGLPDLTPKPSLADVEEPVPAREPPCGMVPGRIPAVGMSRLEMSATEREGR